MPVITPAETEFLEQLNSIIAQQLSNSQFGVEELADSMSMSRSNLLRKVKKLTGMSVNELIAKGRLAKAMELLKTTGMNVSEVGDATGFSSTSYFIKCFREEYGYSPGKTAEQLNIEIEPKKVKWATLIVAGGVVLALALILVLVLIRTSKTSVSEKSIAVLPFKNESSDSSNIYLINGLMESTLNNLQQIGNLKVISRTTSEKYRNTKKSIPEMAKELNVNYFIEGSGQKIGDKILLNIQLIEAATDRHLWAQQYRRETSDIFELQHEIAKSIADEIEVVITPEEERRITKKLTSSFIAYDYFLKGKELFYYSAREELLASLPYFQKAVEYDSTFAVAYGTAAEVYYYLDMYQAVKSYSHKLDSSANMAMKFDPFAPESLVAKGLSYSRKKEYTEAVKYLEQAHIADPNSGLVVHFLTEFYSIHVVNTEKYLEYALKGVKIDQRSFVDSLTTSFKYFHLSNAFVQAGFLDEALMYVDKSLVYNRNNPFSQYFRPYVLYARDFNVKRTREGLIKEYNKDTMRVDIAQEIAKTYYMDRDYRNAKRMYQRFMELETMMHLDIYEAETSRMAFIWKSLGDEKEGDKFIAVFKQYAEKDKSVYRHLFFSSYYCYLGDKRNTIDEIRMFNDGHYYFQYWALLIDKDPMYMDVLGDSPEFKSVVGEMKNQFWANKKKIRQSMEEKGLL
jgi:TolB-like protein/AraC-like DNA-binding protein/tetratricopeptide (TPR) repeat protein